MKSNLKLAIFTDPHLNTPQDESYQKLLTQLHQTCTDEQVDAVVALGDNLNMLGRMHHASNELIESYLHDIMDAAAKTTGLPVFAINGNHDGIGTDFFDLPLWNRAIGNQFAAGLDIHEGDSAYYYVDYPDKLLRLVFLSMPYGSDVTAEYPTPLWAFGEKQLRWLASTALAVPDGYDVLLIHHVPVYYEYQRNPDEQKLHVFNGTTGAESYISALCGWIEDRETLVSILNAFHEKKVCTIPGLELAVDYTGVGCLLASLSGHMHTDGLLLPGEMWKNLPNPLPCPQIVTARSITNGTAGYAIDVVTVSNDGLAIQRVGDGEDRAVTFVR